MEHTPPDEPHKVVTYAEIKEFVNKMTDKQLSRDAYIWIGDNEVATEIHAIDDLGSDMYYFTEHEYSCSKEDYLKDIMCDDETGDPLYETFEEAVEKEEHIVTPKDFVFFHSFDF